MGKLPGTFKIKDSHFLPLDRTEAASDIAAAFTVVEAFAADDRRGKTPRSALANVVIRVLIH